MFNASNIDNRIMFKLEILARINLFTKCSTFSLRVVDVTRHFVVFAQGKVYPQNCEINLLFLLIYDHHATYDIIYILSMQLIYVNIW